MSLIGQSIRGYKFEREIGKGGFGAVYLAWQEVVERSVAIKVILPQFANEPEFQEQFEVEAHLVANLEHPHIIPLYDYWQDETGAYLVMRYVPGGTLSEYLHKEEALTWQQARRLFLQMLEALEVAHDNGVIHRDIKTANILLDDRGNAYLTDFGVAWIAEKAKQENYVTGTVAYLAPELLKGNPPTPQSDLYALGILLFQMLAGRHPFSGNVTQIMHHHIYAPMPSIRELQADIPEEVEAIIYRMTMKDSEERYPNVRALLSELENIDSSQAHIPTATISMSNKKEGLPKSVRPRRNTVELRNRFSMIDAVYTYWIEGVLDNLLSGYALLDLDLQLEPRYVREPDSYSAEDDVITQEIADSVNNIRHVFESYNGKLLVLGEAGVGKSTLLLALARELLYQANEDVDHPIPVVFNLSSWSDKIPLADWIAQELHEKYQVPPAIAGRWIEKDQLLLLLDGLDEVPEQHRENCLQAINQWRDDHSFVDVVVSSRVVDYDALTGRLHLDGAVVIQPLQDEQVTAYLNQIGADTSAMQSLLEENADMRELSHSPLMLSVMITAYRDVTIADLPDFQSQTARHHYLFDRYVDRAWHRRLGEKLFSLEDIRAGFSNLANNMTKHTRTIFQVEDLQPDWLPEASRKSYFNRLQIIIALITSLGWFLSAVFFVSPDEQLFYLVFGAIWGWTMFFGIERFGMIKSLIAFVIVVSILRIGLDLTQTVETYFSKALFRSTLPYTFMLAILHRLYVHTGQVTTEVRSVDALFFSVNSTQWTGTLAGMLGGLVVSMPEFLSGEELSIPVVLFKIIGSGFVAWFVTGFKADQLQLSAGINEKIHRSLRNGLKMGAVGGLSAMAIVAIAFHPEGFDLTDGGPALFNLLPFAVTTFLIYGGLVTIQHYLLRRELVQQSVIPSALIDLLKEGVNLGILRRVGGGFIFIHRYLLEYFAHQDQTQASKNEVTDKFNLDDSPNLT